MPDDVQQQIAELRRKLDSLANVRDTIGEAAYQKGKVDLEAQIQILTQGGAIVAGDVKLDRGSKFVGRDDYSTTIIASPDRYPPEELLTFYYRALANDCCRLPLGIIDTQFIRTSGEQPVPLPDIYVDLDVITPAAQRAPAEQRGKDERAWAWRLLRGEGDDRTPLLDAITRDDEKQIVLLGDPGLGKTTFVNYLTFLLATGDRAAPKTLRGQLVVRLILREVIAQHILPKADRGTAQMLWNALRDDIATRLGRDAADLLMPYLLQRLLKEGGFILLDGLDEVPEVQQRRKVLLEAVRAWVDSLPKERTRVLITARPYAYADKRWHLKGFSIFALAPFNEEQVQRFIDRWYRAVRASLQWTEDTARAKGEQLQAALQERPYLGDLASRPLLLTLMATLHSSWGHLPEDRASLYEETVKLLLGSWQRAREIHGPDGAVITEPSITQALSVDEDRIRGALETLAYTVHQRQRRETATDGAPADITEGEVLLAFKPLLREVDSDELLRYLKHGAGLVIEHQAGVYAFPHRSFQEYLAACHLANQLGFEELCALVKDDSAWWREVFVLAAGKAKQGGLHHAVNVVNMLLPHAPDEVHASANTHWRVAVIAGQAMLELRLAEKENEQDYYAAILNRARRWLMRLIEEGQLPVRERAEAGDVLGQLGDPRFDAQRLYLPKLYHGQPEGFMGFVKIPQGSFVMGSSKGDEEAYSNEYGNPDRLRQPYDYWVARFPVTVAQYRAFVEAKGYEAERWWTKTGWQWRTGAYDSQVENEALRDWLLRRPAELRNRPYQWDDQMRYSNRPVMLVSWFESMAYCAWLSDQLKRDLPKGYIIRLPTEAEWEKAARCGDNRRYPWGDDDWDEQRANIDASGINRVTTVGMYPHGATPNDLHDLGGNVWEWCLSVYQRYPYEPQKNKLNDLETDGSRVLRGGSWFYVARYARCAFRYWFGPVYFLDFSGFRVVLSLASSEF